MTISELMATLKDLWPETFKHAKTLEAWTKEYRRALGDYPPAVVARAYAECMATRTVQSCPKPGEIATVAKRMRGDGAAVTRVGVSGVNMRKFEEFQRTMIPARVKEWLENNPDLVDLGTAEGWAFDMEVCIREQVYDHAMREFQGGERAYGEVTDEDIRAFRGRTESRAALALKPGLGGWRRPKLDVRPQGEPGA